MKKKPARKVLATLMASALLFSSLAIPTFATGGATPTDVGTLTLNSTPSADTIYAEGALTSNANKHELGGNWYSSLIDGNVTYSVTNGSGSDKTFDVNVPIKYAVGTEITSSHDAWSDINNFVNVVGAATDVALGFQLGLPTAISSTDVNYSKTVANRCKIGGTLSKLSDDLHVYTTANNNFGAIKTITQMSSENLETALTTIMYTNVAVADVSANGGAPTKYTITNDTGDKTQRTYEYTLKDSSGADLAKYTINIKVTYAQNAPVGLGKTDVTTEGGNDGSITNVTDKMEYKLSTATTYTAVGSTATTIAGLTAGTYNVRYKADDVNNLRAGADADVIISNSATPPVATKLATPTNLAWDATAKGKATWTSVTNATRYEVKLYMAEIKEDGSLETEEIVETTETDKTFFDFNIIMQDNMAVKKYKKVDFKFSVTAKADNFTDSELEKVGSGFTGRPNVSNLYKRAADSVKVPHDPAHELLGRGYGLNDITPPYANMDFAYSAFSGVVKNSILNSLYPTETDAAFVQYVVMHNSTFNDDPAKAEIFKGDKRKNDGATADITYTSTDSGWYVWDASSNSLHVKWGCNFLTKTDGVWTKKADELGYTIKIKDASGKILTELYILNDFKKVSISDSSKESENVTSPEIKVPTDEALKDAIIDNVIIPDEKALENSVTSSDTVIKDGSGNDVTFTNTDKIKLFVDGTSVSSSVATELKNYAEENTDGTSVVAIPLEIKLDIINNAGADKGTIKKLANPIEITVDIPVALQGLDEYFVVHKKSDGTLEKIVARVNGTKMTFSVSSFSPFSIIGVSRTTVIPPLPPVTPPTPQYPPVYWGGGYSNTGYVTSYKVTFDSQGGSYVAPTMFVRGSIITTTETPTKDGFIFGGWYTDSACTEMFKPETRAEQDITLYARWLTASGTSITTGTPETGTEVPQTGDRTNAILPLSLLALAAAVVIGCTATNKKQKHSK